MSKREFRELIPEEPRRGMMPFEEMERWFEDLVRRPFLSPSWMPRSRGMEMSEISPRVDMYEEGKEIVIKAEIPGMRKEDLEIDLTEDMITIRGEKKTEEKVEKKNYYCIERSFGSFRRQFRLPAETQGEKAKASFKDGVLEVRIPKSEAAQKKAKKLTIQ